MKKVPNITLTPNPQHTTEERAWLGSRSSLCIINSTRRRRAALISPTLPALGGSDKKRKMKKKNATREAKKNTTILTFALTLRTVYFMRLPSPPISSSTTFGSIHERGTRVWRQHTIPSQHTHMHTHTHNRWFACSIASTQGCCARENDAVFHPPSPYHIPPDPTTYSERTQHAAGPGCRAAASCSCCSITTEAPQQQQQQPHQPRLALLYQPHPRASSPFSPTPPSVYFLISLCPFSIYSALGTTQ